jgi:hypothetical protein
MEISMQSKLHQHCKRGARGRSLPSLYWGMPKYGNGMHAASMHVAFLTGRKRLFLLAKHTQLMLRRSEKTERACYRLNNFILDAV